MPIRSMKGYAKSVWQWCEVLKGCFGNTTIEPSDIDGIVERNGYFLILETKGRNASLSRGQEIMLRRLAKLDKFTVVVVWGDRYKPERLLVMTKKGDKYYDNISVIKLRHVVIEWWLEANKDGRDKQDEIRLSSVRRSTLRTR